MAINFNLSGSFKGLAGDGIDDLANPTTLQFGPDGRMYVAEQSGRISAFTIELNAETGQYSATDHEELLLPNGGGVVQAIMNHNDDGSKQPFLKNRQITGILVGGTAANPVLYVSSSDPRIAAGGEQNLDTNSGTLTKVTWTGTEWEAIDLIRGLPRSEENHATNGMVFSPDGNTLYLAVGGNTNNGAPSEYFSYTGEYALSGAVLAIDLIALEALPTLTDGDAGKVDNGFGGVNEVSRAYKYDLPTLDDPNTPNVDGGGGEDANGLDEDGPFGGNDGLNMAILPADAPISIYADGFRNPYDLVMTEDGKLYTVDNGSNTNFGGNPLNASGTPTDEYTGSDPLNENEATNTANFAPGIGNPEPLFLIQPGEYYGHPNPARANQNLSWTVYDDNGNPDASLTVNTVADLSALVPAGVNIAPGFLIDPSKFTADPNRLLESGIRVEYEDPASPSLINIGSSSNGLTQYTGTAFNGALQGALLVAQFNNTITLLNVNDDGTAVEPFIDPGDDGLLGTADDVVLAADGEYNLITGLSTPLDVTTGPDGTIWVAEIGGDFIKAFSPTGGEIIIDEDSDNDGILNVDDPFIRDASNGTAVTLFPGQTLVWDFDPNQDNNLPGPNGYATGLTGVMIDGVTDFEAFFVSESTLPQQNIKLDNVKFNTAAGGGATVVEYVSNGDALTTANNGEYLFHTGLTLAPTIDTFTIKWSVINPLLTGPDQQIGGYIGTGDQSNYLKLVATANPAGEIQILLEDDDAVVAEVFLQADDLFSVPSDQEIFFELEVDPADGTATPTVIYETGGGNTTTVTGNPIDLNGTAVLDAILGNHTVQGQSSGLAVGLYASNTGQPEAPGGPSFQATFTDLQVTASGNTSSTILYRVNAGGPEIVAIDGGPNWTADQGGAVSPFLADPGSNSVNGFNVVPGVTVVPSTPADIFQTERFDFDGGSAMAWAFDVATPGFYEVRLFVGNGFEGTALPGQRVFDVSIEGNVLSNLDDIDLAADFGQLTGAMISNIVQVTDGTIDIEFLHGEENPLINGIEILKLGGGPAISIVGGPYTVNEAVLGGQVQVAMQADDLVPSDETVDVTFEIVPGTATAAVDYSYTSPSAIFDAQTGIYTDTVTIAGSSTDVTFLVDILQDQLTEGDEAFTVNIIGLSGNAEFGPTTSTTVTIQDDEAANFLSIAPVLDGNETGPIAGQFTVSLSAAATTDTIVAYSVGGTATAGSDYTALTGTVTIPAGELSAPIDVTVIDDLLPEGTESVAVTLDSITAADSDVLIGTTNSATVTITDDDNNVVVAINAGGPSLTQDGIDFIADAFFIGGGTYEDGLYDADQPVFDGTIYETEHNAGSSLGSFEYSIPVAAGEYTVELHFAEIFWTTSGNRVFDVEVEGQLVLDDVDILVETGGNINQPFVFNVPGSISPDTFGAPDAIDIAFSTAADQAKVSGIVIRSVTPAVTPEVNLTVTPAAGSETEGTVITITATASAAVTGDQTVDVILSGTDVTAADFVETVPTQLTILDGQTTASFSLTIADDAVLEAVETATFSIANPTVGLVLGATASGDVVITGYNPPLDDLFGTAIEISGDRLSPTNAGILAPGDNVVTATQEGEVGNNSFRDRDIFTFTVPDGFVLTGIELQDFVNPNPLLSPGFFGLQLGSQLTVDVVTGEPDPGTDGLLGGIIY